MPNKDMIRVGDSLFNIDMCTFSIYHVEDTVMDPYDMSKTVKVKYGVLRVFDAVTQSHADMKLVNPDDPALRAVSRALRERGIVLDAKAAKFKYLEEGV